MAEGFAGDSTTVCQDGSSREPDVSTSGPGLDWRQLPPIHKFGGFVVLGVMALVTFGCVQDKPHCVWWIAAGFVLLFILGALGYLVTRQSIAHSYDTANAQLRAQIRELSWFSQRHQALTDEYIDACRDLVIAGRSEYADKLRKVIQQEIDRAIIGRASAVLAELAARSRKP